jgi:hypothetical protein
MAPRRRSPTSRPTSPALQTLACLAGLLIVFVPLAVRALRRG